MTAALEHVCEFVNTVDLEAAEEVLDSPAALRDWLVAHDLLDTAAVLDEADLGAALALREALRALALAHHGDGQGPPREAVETLDRLAARARFTLRVGADASVRLEPTAGGVEGALGRLLAAVEAAAVAGTWERFKACPWDTCRWAFVDQSKNRSRTWCSMQVCGNRAKARAFRSRLRSSGAPA